MTDFCRRAAAALHVAFALVVLIPRSAPAQERLPASDAAAGRTIPADAFEDSAARDVVLGAMALRDEAATGLASYEATAVERLHVGLRITRRLPLRARTLYHRERIARVFWDGEGSGPHRIRWIGRREGRPTFGDGWSSDAPFDLDFDIVDDLSLDDIAVSLLFDPRGDRIDLFQADFVQPISDEGMLLYRFSSADTTRIGLPALGRTLELVEIIVRPREAAWEAVEGSLWFDRVTGALVRAAFRPSGVWDEGLRNPWSIDDVPGFLLPAIGTVSAIAIEYSLIEGRWWLPWRVTAEADYDWGHGLVRMPIRIEWTMSDPVVNRAPSVAVTPGEQLAVVRRSGWGGEAREETMHLAKPGVDLSRAAELPAPLVEGEAVAFTRAELQPLLDRIVEVGGPPPEVRPSLRRALLASTRYDRVRGFSVGHSSRIDLGQTRLEPALRVAGAIPDVHARLAVTRDELAVSAYRELADASDWNVADGIGNSVAALVFGIDGGDYYRVDGASLGIAVGGDQGSRVRLEVFGERHRPIERQTSASLATIGGGELRPNIAARRLDVGGLRGEVAGQVGSPIGTTALNWRLRGEAAAGDLEYARGLASVRLTAQLASRVSSSLEVSAGAATDSTPVQRQFLLGGVGTVRGLGENAAGGRAFWLARAEAGAGLPGMRAIVFTDVGWVGDRDAFTTSRPSVGVGLGGSVLDGLLRVDVARGVVRARKWRAYFYLDALL